MSEPFSREVALSHLYEWGKKSTIIDLRIDLIRGWVQGDYKAKGEDIDRLILESLAIIKKESGRINRESTYLMTIGKESGFEKGYDNA